MVVINCESMHENTALYVNQRISGYSFFECVKHNVLSKRTNSLLQCAALFPITIATHHGSEEMLEKGKDGVRSIDCNMTLLPVFGLICSVCKDMQILVYPYKTLTKCWLLTPGHELRHLTSSRIWLSTLLYFIEIWPLRPAKKSNSNIGANLIHSQFPREGAIQTYLTSNQEQVHFPLKIEDNCWFIRKSVDWLIEPFQVSHAYFKKL